MNYLNETYSIIKVLHYHDLKVIKNEKEQNCSICDNPININTIIFSCEECSLNICPPCLQMLYLINEYKIPLSKLKLKNLLNHNKKCKPNFIIIPNENTEKQCDECKSSNNNFMLFCDTCKNFHLCLKCYSKSSNEKIALSYYFHEHPMKEIIMDNNHICDLCNGRGDFSFSSFQCKICDLDICEKCLDKLIIINQPINSSDKFLEFKKNKFFSCTKCKKDFKEERENEFCYMLSNDDMNLCIDCYCSNKKVNYEILNHRKNYITLFSNSISTDLINENESLRNNNSKLKLLLDALFIELLKEKKKNDENDEKEKEEKSENDENKEKSENDESKEKSENEEKENNENSENKENKENNKKINIHKNPLLENNNTRNTNRDETPLTVDNKNLNNNIPEQKIIKNSIKKRESKINEIELPKEIKKEKVKTLKNINILDNVKEYFPGDISRDEIEEMVLSAVGDSLVKEINFKKGVNLTMEHAQAIIDLLYMNINETNNGDKNYEKILEGVKLKIGFCDINKDSIKNIMLKGQNPTDEEIEQVLEQFEGSINPKLFVIELIK